MATFDNWLSRRKGKHSSDVFKLDTKTKTPEENIIEIIQGLYLKRTLQNDISPTSKTPSENKQFVLGLRGTQRNSFDSYRLSYLNALVTLLCKGDRSQLGFTTDELMTCIRVSLVDESMVIRAAALRVLRYLIKSESDVATFNILKLPYLVMRSMDLMLRNEEERAQALRVVRRVIGVIGAVGPSQRRYRAAFIDPGLLRCLASVARAGSAGDGTCDRLSRPAVATLAEICVLNADLFISCGGVNAVTRQLAECATPRMAEALCGVLLHTLNEPSSRRAARIDLTCLSAPYCDFHIKPAGTDTTRDEREMRFTCSRLALLCVLRSWPGLLHFCHPDSVGGLKALVSALHLPRLEVRKAILDLLYELVGLPQPEWTDEISVALGAVDPSDFQDTWRLNEGFVAAEGNAILPHLSATGPDITEIHLALLLQCFLEAGLLDGLAEVIVTSDTFISVRATVLLGQLLHLIHLFLPPQICNITPALPTLMSQASAGKPKALAAIAALRKLHSMLEARPACNSLFLDHIMQYCSGAFIEKDIPIVIKSPHIALYKDISIELLNESDNENEPRQRHSVGSRIDVANRNMSALPKSNSVSSRTGVAVGRVAKTSKFFSLFERDSDNLIRSTLVMQNKDGNTWNWDVIRTILKENDSTPFLNLNDSGHKAWAARVINYLKPSSNKYSHTDLSSTCHGHTATRAGCQLIRHLLHHNDSDSQRLLEDLFTDVSRQIEAIETGRKAHECLFSPQHMCNTMCQMYFLFIGQLCHSHNGLKLFKQTKLYENLLDLSTKTHHSCYVKLVISSLDYTLDSCPRDILAKTLTCNIQASRLYATQFLNVLLRASEKSREIVRRKAKIKTDLQEQLKSQRDNSEASGGTDMETWLLQMLVGQVKDESKVVVKCALSILEEAYSVPALSDKLTLLKDILGQNCRIDKAVDPTSLDLAAIGDRAYLLWLSLEVNAAAQSNDVKSSIFLKKHLDFWSKLYNYRYVRLVESGVHEALTLCESGRGAPRTRRSARLPLHLHSALVAGPLRSTRSRLSKPLHSLARSLLVPVLPAYYKILQHKSCNSEQEITELKASLWALGHTAVSLQGLQMLMNLSDGYLEDSVPVHVVRLARYCPVYSVRATAFYVLGLIGSTYNGANLLSELGWLCVRHTRHEQFPIIQDDFFSTPHDLTCTTYSITSPDRRYTFDTDISEHSDHTDQSMSESLPFDNKLLNVTSITIEETDTKDKDVVDTVLTVETRREPDKRKSHTLPSHGCSHDRLMISESRTVDILRDYAHYEGPRIPSAENRLLIGRMNSLDHAHEGRVRNTSESSTSGVSSCDSFLGKYAIPDRVLTLSPIPSSSSLYGMKSSSTTQRPRLSETQRRTSSSSFTGPEVASSPPSHIDMSGYATWKALNRHRRPHLSESAASGSSDIDDITWLLSDTSRRSKPFSSLRDRAKSTRERATKLSLLEYDWRPLPLGESAEVREPPAPHSPRPAPAPPPAHRHAAYIGICLPRDLSQLFPRDKDGIEREDMNEKSEPKRLRLPSFLIDSGGVTSAVVKSRATPDSQRLSASRGAVGRGTSAAVAPISVAGQSGENVTVASEFRGVLRLEDIKLSITNSKSNVSNQTEGSTQPKTIEPQISQAASTADMVPGRATSSPDSHGGRATSTADSHASKTTSTADSHASRTASGGASEAETVARKADVWRHIPGDCLACVRTRPPSSHELREAFFSGMESSGGTGEPRSWSESPTAESAAPQTEALRHVHFMSNPIHLRQTRSALLSLKQRHPDVFRSPCVYSDVCALLSRDTYMLCARRFLHELFLDADFSCFRTEPVNILARHLPLSPLTPH